MNCVFNEIFITNQKRQRILSCPPLHFAVLLSTLNSLRQFGKTEIVNTFLACILNLLMLLSGKILSNQMII